MNVTQTILHVVGVPKKKKRRTGPYALELDEVICHNKIVNIDDKLNLQKKFGMGFAMRDYVDSLIGKR